LNKKPMKVIVL